MRYILILILLSGCYNLKKATVQHGRAAATYPAVAADYCARVYPAKDSIIQGATIVRTDTLWGEGETRIDTVFVAGKPVEVTKTIILPGQTITIERLRVDTVRYENTAALDLANIEKRALSLALTTEQTRADKYQGRSRKYLWILIALAGGAAVWLFFKLRKK
jgi:hypothetical protein